MNRREFTLSTLAAALGTAAVLPEFAYSRSSEHERSLLQLQQDFLDLRFGMFIHLNMATYEPVSYTHLDVYKRQVSDAL